MRKLTDANTVNAVERNFARKCKVSRASFDGVRGKFQVRCDKGHTHTVEVERRRADLYARCFFEETGEVCPAELGGHVCYHITACVGWFEWHEARREELKRAAGRNFRARCGIATRHLGGKQVEHVRGIRL